MTLLQMKKNIEQNKKLAFIADRIYRILIIGGSGSGKANELLNLIKEQSNIDKVWLNTKDVDEAKYKFLIEKR